MKKHFIIFFLLTISLVYSQIGVNTPNPIGSFHIDAAKNNPVSGLPSLSQQADDFMISKTGVVSIGILAPSPYSSLEIESKKGLRLPQLTSAEISALDAIPSVGGLDKKNGLTVYNSTTKCINFWVPTEWREICGNSLCTPVTGTPQISPSNPSLQVGTSTTFIVTGVTNAISYIWKVNGIIQSGETQAYFNYTPSSTSSVAISAIAVGCNNSQTSETSASGTPVPACKPVTGTLQITPANPSLQVGVSTTFVASGVSNATGYIWKVNGSVQSGQTQASFSYTPTSTSAVAISVIAVGCNNSETSEKSSSGTPSPACKPVTGTLQITPANPSLQVGVSTTFVASGVSNATGYIWKVNGSVQSGQTQASFSYTPTSTSAVAISVIAVGCNNSETSEKSSSGTPSPACNPVTGTLQITPANPSLQVGVSTTFVASGVSNATGYIWKVNGSVQSGQTQASFSYTPTSTSAVAISVIAVGCNNSETSEKSSSGTPSPACNPVTGTLQITPANPSLQVGVSTTFVASGVTNATGYIWKVNGSVQSGQTQSSFSYTPTSTSAVAISVIAVGCNNSETSEKSSSGTPSPACNPVTGTLQITPANPSLQVGVSTTFVASGVTNATGYIWKVNGSVQSGETQSSFSYTPSSTSAVAISAIAIGCNNSQTSEKSVSGTPRPKCTPLSGTLAISPSSAQMQVNGSKTFTASGASNVTSYEWKVNSTVQSATGSTFTYTASATGTVTISVTAKGACSNDTKTASASVTVSRAAFSCTGVGRFLKADTDCKEYHYCFMNNGLKQQDYVCPGSTLFDEALHLCQPTIASCPY